MPAHPNRRRWLAAAAVVLAALALLAGLATPGPRALARPFVLPAIVLGPPIGQGDLTNPLGMAHAGDARIFVVEKDGYIRIVETDTVRPTPFLDVSALVSQGSEQGLLGLAFHPNYASNGYFYIHYTDLNGDIVVARYSRSAGDPNVADPTSRFPILTVPHPVNDNHNGGQLAFGPDGYLYLGPGDGGGTGDPDNNAQNRNVLLGKLLRIDVNAPAPTPYVVPTTNPFYGQAGARGEIWAWGLRNPWRFSFDAQTGDLLIGDVGQDSWEEVDFQPAGDPGGTNYGWRLWEGQHCYDPPSGCTPTPGATPFYPWATPVAEYSSGGAGSECAMIGGYVYRGTRYPLLQGAYFFGDLCSGQIWALQHSGSTWTMTPVLVSGLPIGSFGEDVNGELYVVSLSGALYPILGAENRVMLPALLYNP
jgi:glucose/arabinose dehydrogenase